MRSSWVMEAHIACLTRAGKRIVFLWPQQSDQGPKVANLPAASSVINAIRDAPDTPPPVHATVRRPIRVLRHLRHDIMGKWAGKMPGGMCGSSRFPPKAGVSGLALPHFPPLKARTALRTPCTQAVRLHAWRRMTHFEIASACGVTLACGFDACAQCQRCAIGGEVTEVVLRRTADAEDQDLRAALDHDTGCVCTYIGRPHCSKASSDQGGIFARNGCRRRDDCAAPSAERHPRIACGKGNLVPPRAAQDGVRRLRAIQSYGPTPPGLLAAPARFRRTPPAPCPPAP